MLFTIVVILIATKKLTQKFEKQTKVLNSDTTTYRKNDINSEIVASKALAKHKEEVKNEKPNLGVAKKTRSCSSGKSAKYKKTS